MKRVIGTKVKISKRIKQIIVQSDFINEYKNFAHLRSDCFREVPGNLVTL